MTLINIEEFILNHNNKDIQLLLQQEYTATIRDQLVDGRVCIITSHVPDMVELSCILIEQEISYQYTAGALLLTPADFNLLAGYLRGLWCDVDAEIWSNHMKEVL